METVRFEKGMNLADALNSAGRINNSREITRIIGELNETSFETSKSLMKSIKKYTDELDPFEPYNTISYIIDSLEPRHKELIDPVNMIMNTSIKQRRNLSLCFGGA
jgi:hypothetical protein